MSSSNDLRSFFAMVKATKSKARVEERVAERLYQTRGKPDTPAQILEAAGTFLPPGSLDEATPDLTKAAMAIFKHHHSGTKRAKDEVELEDVDSGVIVIDDDEEDEGEDVNSDDKEDLDVDDLQDQIDARDELLVDAQTTLLRMASIATKLHKRIKVALDTE